MNNYNIIVIYIYGTIYPIALNETTEAEAISTANQAFTNRVGVDKVIVVDNECNIVYTIEA